MNARVLVLAVAAALAGCATDGPPLLSEPGKKVRPLSTYSADPFVPVNLYVNANEHSAKPLGQLAQYAADRLRQSGAFARVDQGVQRWPITLQARYRLREYAGQGDYGRRFLRWLTLGFMPVQTSQVHTLTAEVLAEPQSLATLEFSVTMTDHHRSYEERPSRGERAAADALLEQLLSEIAQRKLIPRWAAFKPDAGKPVQNPVKPTGQPT